MYMQPFRMEVARPENLYLMEVSTVFIFCKYCVFTCYGRHEEARVLSPCSYSLKNIIYIDNNYCHFFLLHVVPCPSEYRTVTSGTQTPGNNRLNHDTKQRKSIFSG